MNRFITIVLSVIVAVLTVTLSANDKVRERKLQQAIDLIESKGDLARATPLLEDVAKSTDRALAARGLLHLAQAQDRYGSGDALATYQRILREFGGATEAPKVAEVAMLARTTLAAAGQKDGGITVRKVGDQFVDTISPDGRYLTYTDWDTGNLGVRDVASGRDRVLTVDGHMPERFAESAVSSPDSRRIAYYWRDYSDGTRSGELRVIGRDGGRPIVVYRHDEKAPFVRPVGWSPDGTAILAYTRNVPGDGNALLMFPVDGSTARLIRRFERNAAPGDFNMSPNGRFIAYDRPATPGKPERDVFLLSIDSGRQVSLGPNPANDYMLGWFPEGNRILFASDRAGTIGIWSVRLAGGQVIGEPMLIRPNAGSVRAHGFTRRGDFYYTTVATESEVYLASLDPGTGRQTSAPARLEGRYTGFKMQAAWSPDGGRIAYVQEPLVPASGPVRNQQLVIQTTATGALNPLTLAMQNMQNPTWLPDGRSVIVQGRDLQGSQGLHRVDIQTGAVTAIALREPGNDIRRMLAAPSPDGRRVFFQWSSPAAPDQGGIGVREFTGGDQTLMTTAVENFALSPDGQWIAAIRPDDGQGPLLFIIPSAGGEPRPIAAGASGWSTALAWSPDGKSVLVARKDAALTTEIWLVPVDGSAPRATGIRWPANVLRISAHPDGRQLAISTSGLAIETWLLQNIPPQREK